MKTKHATKFNKVLVILITVVFVMGNMISVAFADVKDPLKPEDKVYEDDNIVLHKQAERIAADEWRINVKAYIKDSPVEPPKMEVVFVLDASGSMLSCTNEALHNLGTHYDHSNCPIICGNSEHTHENSCYLCGLRNQIHAAMSECCYQDDTVYVDYQTRFELAKQAIENMISKLPEGTHIGRISFNSKDNAKYHEVDKDNPGKDPYDNIEPRGWTYMMDGVRLALSHEECFTDDPSTQKIMIIVTDGAASDNDYGENDEKFKEFKDNGGIVYTIGFNHTDENLSKMIANGGTYNRAADGAELEKTFDHITAELTAMLVDPMGTAVGFEKDSVQSPTSSVPGEITYVDNTLYWNPTDTGSIENSYIEYSYSVKLNENANFTTGVHKDVKLNNPTNLLYGIKSAGVTNMKTAEFPIPEATYAVSTMQVKWKYRDQNLKTPTDTEKFICDWEKTDFETDYKTITQEITVDGVNYYYAGTVITKNGEKVRQVVPADAADYVVTHKYELQPVVLTYDVNYKYTGEVPAGAPEAPSFNQSGVEAGESVDVAADPSVEGYDFSGWKVVEGDAEVANGSFTMPEENVTLQGSFTKIRKATAVVHYVDEDGNALKEDTVSDEIRVGDTYDVSEAKDVNEITVDGKTYVFVSDNENAVYAGNMPEGGVEITRVYTLKSYYYKVLVNYFTSTNGGAYVKDNAKAVEYVGRTETKETSVNVDLTGALTYNGGTYANPALAEESAAATIAGNNVTFAPADDTAVVTVNLYRDVVHKATATVHYVDENGNKIKDDTTSGEVNVGSAYDLSEAEAVNEIIYDGKTYVFVSDTAGAKYAETMPDGGVDITRKYTLKSYSYNVFVNYFTSTNGGAYVKDNAEAVEYVELTETKETSVDVDLTDALTYGGNTYGKPALADGSAAATLADGKVTVGLGDDTAVVIVNLYRDVIHKATAVVHYVDTEGNTLQEDTVSDEINVGSAYDVSEAKDVSEIKANGKTYVFESESDNAIYTGTMPDGGVEITRVYRLVDPTDPKEPTEPTTPTGDDTELNDSPSTGDQSMWLWMILLAASTCGIVVVLEGRKRSY